MHFVFQMYYFINPEHVFLISDMNSFRYDHCTAAMNMWHKSMNKLKGISNIIESNP